MNKIVTVSLTIEIKENVCKILLSESEECFLFKKKDLNFTFPSDLKLSPDSTWVLFYALFARIYDVHAPNKGEVRFHLEKSIPCFLIERIARFYQFKRIRCLSWTDKSSFSSAESSEKIFHLFGGGKDSLATLLLASKLYGKKNNSLIRFHWSASGAKRHKEAFYSYCYQNVEELTGAFCYDVMTEIHSSVLDTKYAKAMHMGLYFFLSLPFIIKYKPKYLNFSYDATEYYDLVNGSHSDPYRLARPSAYKMIEDIYQYFGANTNIINISSSIPAYVHFNILDFLCQEPEKHIYMCESFKSKWCGRCQKCLLMAFYSISRGKIEFLKTSGIFEIFYSKRFLDLIEKTKSLNKKAFIPEICYPTHTVSMINLLSSLDIHQLKKIEDDNVVREIKVLVAFYKSDLSKDFEGVWRKKIFRTVEEDKKYYNLIQEMNIPIIIKKQIEGRLRNEKSFYYPQSHQN